MARTVLTPVALSRDAGAKASHVRDAQSQYSARLEESREAKQMILRVPDVLEYVPADRRIDTRIGQRDIGEVAVEDCEAEMLSSVRRSRWRQLDADDLPAALARERQRMAVRRADFEQPAPRRGPALEVGDPGTVPLAGRRIALERNRIALIVVFGKLGRARRRRHELQPTPLAAHDNVAALHEALLCLRFPADETALVRGRRRCEEFHLSWIVQIGCEKLHDLTFRSPGRRPRVSENGCAFCRIGAAVAQPNPQPHSHPGK